MKGPLHLYVVRFNSAAGTHFRRAKTKQEALAIARELRSAGHAPRVLDLHTGKTIYGREPFSPDQRKAA
jgi:hypothetical protein